MIESAGVELLAERLRNILMGGRWAAAYKSLRIMV
jgi:hypothetical protein